MTLLLAAHTCGHDVGVALFDGPHLVFSVEAERLTRNKHEGDIEPAIQLVERELPDLVQAIELVVMSTNLCGNSGIRGDVEQVQAGIGPSNLHTWAKADIIGREIDCIVVAHEASHAALAAHYAGWRENTVVLVNEGRGTFSRNALFHCNRNALRLLDYDLLPWYATGLGWSGFAFLAGFGKNPSAAGKAMALSAFGQRSHDAEAYLKSLPINAYGRDNGHMIEAGERAVRYIAKSIGKADVYACVGLALQNLFTATIVDTLERVCVEWSSTAVAIGGGCALNLYTNTAIRDRFEHVGVAPAPNDSGQAIGAGLYALHFVLGVQPSPFSPWCNGLAPGERGADLLLDAGMTVSHFEPEAVASHLAAGRVVAFCDGVSAIGPRSLGNRSLLADPKAPGMKDRVSCQIKGREHFRPLAPVFTSETFDRLFPETPQSPCMLYNYSVPGDLVPEATHVDGTSRVQTLSSEANPRLRALLQSFEKATGTPALINTSLNKRGRAICYSYDDVLHDFRNDSAVDVFVFGSHVGVRPRV